MLLTRPILFTIFLSFFSLTSHAQLVESTLFPDGSMLAFRCNNTGAPGFYALEGNSSLTCNDGIWSSRIPFCRVTSKPTEFSGKNVCGCKIMHLLGALAKLQGSMPALSWQKNFDSFKLSLQSYRC